MKKVVQTILGIELAPLSFDLRPKIEGYVNNSEFLQSSKDRLTSKERVDFLFNYFNVTFRIDQNWSDKFRKNSTVAGKLREKGNEFYKKREFGNALDCYNVAIVFAPQGDQELGLAYANRSIVLLELGHPEEALADVELALINNYPKPSVLKKRRRKCNEMIDQKNEMRDDESEKARMVKEEITERQKIREEMLQIKNPNPNIPEAADFVTIEHDEVMGRKLVVTQDVPAGTVLMVSEPYVTALFPNEGWHSDRCHYCLKRVRRGIPCESCVFAFYCNDSCRQEAHEEYHKFECPFMEYLNGEVKQVALGFRIVCKAGPKKLFQLFKSQDPAYFNREMPFGNEEGCKFNEDPYLAVYHMVAHSEKFDEREDGNVEKTCCAVALALMLGSQTEFFQEVPKRRRMEFTKFVATLIRHHTDSASMNTTILTESRSPEDMSLADLCNREIDSESLSRMIKSSEVVEFVLALYPLASLANHSCNPNVFFVADVSKARKIMVASRALQAGDVIYGSYSVDFMDTPLEDRQQILRNKFHITCQCVACVNDWPIIHVLPGGGVLLPVHQFCCPTCSVKYSIKDRASADFIKKCGLNEEGLWKCKSCDKQYCGDTLQLLYALNVRMANEAGQLYEINRPREAIPKLLEAIQFFQTHVCPPSYYLSFAEKDLFVALSYVFDSLSW